MDARIPNKLFFKIGEVCEITETQPYVLRYWESEFDALAPQKSAFNQRMYTRRDVETVLLIKKLLYEEKFSIAGAKKKTTSSTPVSWSTQTLPFESVILTIASKLSVGSEGVAFSVTTYKCPPVNENGPKLTSEPAVLVPLPSKIGGSIRFGAEVS